MELVLVIMDVAILLSWMLQSYILNVPLKEN